MIGHYARRPPRKRARLNREVKKGPSDRGTDVAVRTPTLTLDPQLGALGEYPGETPTLALLVGSPAIDATTSATCSPPVTDQRGKARPVGSECDLGAFEFDPADPIPSIFADGFEGGNTMAW